MKDFNQIERRAIIEIRASETDRKISGTAIVFDKESQLLGDWFTEIIKPEAVTQALLNSCDILMLWNHEDGQIPMARSKRGKGSLKISLTATGVDFEFEARKTPQGDEILAAVRAGDVDGCSFAFRVAEDGDEWQSKPEGAYLRIISKFETIRDLSLVNEPAYLDTSCRSLKAEFEKRNKTSDPPKPADPPATDPPKPADPPTPTAEEAKAKELADYYKPLDEAYYKTFEDDIAQISKE